MTDIMISNEGTEQLPLRRFTEEAYLNYSMYVIMDRALPFIGDGLKPIPTPYYLCDVRAGFIASGEVQKICPYSG